MNIIKRIVSVFKSKEKEKNYQRYLDVRMAFPRISESDFEALSTLEVLQKYKVAIDILVNIQLNKLMKAEQVNEIVGFKASVETLTSVRSIFENMTKKTKKER